MSRESGIRCWNCVWWGVTSFDDRDRASRAECRRFPPRAPHGWHEVSENDWCGEYQPEP